SSLALKSFFGSATRAPLGNVNLTEFLSASPMQTIPSWDQTATPAGLLGFFHFTSSTTEGEALLIEARSRASVSPRQSRRALTIASISCEALLTCEIMPFRWTASSWFESDGAEMKPSSRTSPCDDYRHNQAVTPVSSRRPTS